MTVGPCIRRPFRSLYTRYVPYNRLNNLDERERRGVGRAHLETPEGAVRVCRLLDIHLIRLQQGPATTAGVYGARVSEVPRMASRY